MLIEEITKTKYLITFNTEEEKSNFINSINPPYSTLPINTDFDAEAITVLPRSLKAAEVMSMLDISRVTLCHYVKRGLVKIDSNYTGKQYRYDYESVMKLKNKDIVI